METATTTRIRVLCVDDHQFLTDGLASRINLERDMQCVGSLPSAEGLAEQAESLRADVVILDLEMPGPDSLEMLAQLKSLNESVRVIVLTAHVRDHYIDQALKFGAAGYFSKNDPPTAIIDGIRRVMHDEPVFGDNVQERLETTRSHGETQVATKLQSLSPREIEVLRLIGKGLSRADIARQLFRSLKTVDAHHTSIMRKLDIHDRAELTRFAIREGLSEA
jgi:DNA-binding NarL/FixJ family response regulator